MSRDLDLADVLPGILRAMARELGLGPVLRLVRWRGGRHVYIPKDPHDDHPLVHFLGRRAADWLAGRLAGEYLQVPKAERYMLAVRDADIRRRHWRDGLSADRLAAEYELHVRQVWRILAARTGERRAVPQRELL